MFKINDTVLCIDAKPVHGDPKKLIMDIKEGSSYRVAEVSVCKCHMRLALVESAGSRVNGPCYTCREPTVGYYSWRFMKIAGDDIQIEDTTLDFVTTEEAIEINKALVKELEKEKHDV